VNNYLVYAWKIRMVKGIVVAGLWGRRCEWSDGFILLSGGMRIPGDCATQLENQKCG